MANNLNSFFVTFLIYKGNTQVHSMTVPKSLIHDMFQKWKFNGSDFDVKIVDHTSNTRVDTSMFGAG